MFVSAEDAVKWMEERRFITKGTEAFAAYMKTLGDPHRKISCIHIAGTNGKGSTLNYLRCVLQEAGYKIGTFSSPYLETHFDRICINAQNIPEEFFLDTVNAHYEEWIAHELNMFEIDFVIAALYFYAYAVDVAIYEAGLGGRKDATNVLLPLVSIITNIGMDHMELLGDTHEQIAYEKAGIVKDGIPLITAEHKPSCLDVFQKICKEKKSPLIVTKQIEGTVVLDGISFTYGDHSISLEHTPYYQINNITCVLEALSVLSPHVSVDRDQLMAGLKKARWKGRFETMCVDPLIIVDGAHNVEGVEALCASMASYEDIHIIFAVLKDKDHNAMLERLLKLSRDVTVCDFACYRESACEVLARSYPIAVERDYKKAIDLAMRKKGTRLITGSLYFISSVRKYLQEILSSV